MFNPKEFNPHQQDCIEVLIEKTRRGRIRRGQGAVMHIGGDGGFEISNRGAEPVLQFGDDPFDKGGGIGDVLIVRCV